MSFLFGLLAFLSATDQRNVGPREHWLNSGISSIGERGAQVSEHSWSLDRRCAAVIVRCIGSNRHADAGAGEQGRNRNQHLARATAAKQGRRGFERTQTGR